MQLYHYTSPENWESIQEDGFLLPFSRKGFNIIHLKTSLGDIVNQRKYTCSIPKDNYDAWKEYGLIHRLLDNRSDDILLEFPLLDEEKSFVREQAMFSPKRFIEKYKKDFMEAAFSKKYRLNFKETMIFFHYSNQYMNSLIPFKEYDGQFKVPEIITPQKTPVKLIKIIRRKDRPDKAILEEMANRHT